VNSEKYIGLGVHQATPDTCRQFLSRICSPSLVRAVGGAVFRVFVGSVSGYGAGRDLSRLRV
jgi:hypothetical protein